MENQLGYKDVLEVVREKMYSVTETFLTMQGEGPMAGRLTAFLRLHYCGSSCSWCDTRYSWDKTDPGYNNFTKMTAKEIREKLVKLHMRFPGDGNISNRSRTVTISGGDPVIQLDDTLVDHLSKFFRLQIETQGMLFKDCLTKCDTVVMSPKPPSSGQPELTNQQLLAYEQINDRDRLYFKVVIFDEIDFSWAYELYRRVHALYMFKPKFYLQAGTPTQGDITDVVLDSYRRLVDMWLTKGVMHDAVILPQIHALVWGRRKGI